MSNVNPLTSAGFSGEVLQSEMPVVVDFYATWCPPCRALAPELDGLADEYEGRIKFLKVNIDAEPSLADRYGISAVPTVMLFRDGQIVDELRGFAPGAVKRRLERLAPGAASRT